MQTYIISIKVNLPEGFVNAELEFSQGVNFISGENGTGKSKILNFIHGQHAQVHTVAETNDGNALQGERVAFYNPKRNTQKREIEGHLAALQRENKTVRSFRGLVNQVYSDQNFVEYPSFADLFVTTVEETIRTQNKPPETAAKMVEKELNVVLSKLMPSLRAEATWVVSDDNGEARLVLHKQGARLRPTDLSVGENEIISLALSVYLYREYSSLYLIDEPEVHLNWSLEKQLFDFLGWFCIKFKKQMIVVTHSPVVFEEQFVNDTYFLSWEGDKVVASKTPSEALTNKLASRVAASFISLEDAYDKSFFVEDKSSAYVVHRLAELKEVSIRVVVMHGRDKVISLYNAFEPKLANAYFMVDGDNDDERNGTFSGNLFALEKYCIENYFLDFDILTSISKKTKYNTADKVKKLILKLVKNHNNREFKKRYKPHIALADSDPDQFFTMLDSMDGSLFVTDMKLYKELGYGTVNSFMKAYIQYCKDNRKLNSRFKELVNKLAT